MYIDGTNPDGLIGDTGNGKIVIEYILFLCILVLLKIKNKKETDRKKQEKNCNKYLKVYGTNTDRQIIALKGDLEGH